MSLQVNLLKKAERRYQGIVSMKFMVLASVGVLVGITLLVFLLAGVSKMTLNANLDRARSEWKRLEPQAITVRIEQVAAAANRKTLGELNGWATGDHPSMSTILYAVQGRIPAQMALDHFFAGSEQAFGGSSAVYTLRFSGRALGELTAVEAKRELNADADLRHFCGEIKLVSSQRESGEAWIFAFEGHRPAEGVSP
jgi:hypothetical protein